MQAAHLFICRPLTLRRLLLLAAQVLVVLPSRAVEPPRVLDEGWQIELIASEPGLVTPTGCCFDDQGRLLVIECHTHFPPDEYDGPKQDRIFLFDDSDGDGVLDRQRLFYEGGSATMGLCRLADGWIAVGSRSEVIRIRDSNGDDKADEREVLVSLRTEQTYPHNGLTGLAIGPDGWLYIGQGENLGDPYNLVAADSSNQIGGGEGGNIFRCRPDGSDLERYATGLWNPFGLCFDSQKRLWMVGNDPDAMPPCRLLQIVPTADYGFQFRFGRAGTHPLQSWNGELPGTLPMAAGTGEAPCAVVPLGDRLWVSSWGDNRIETYRLSPQGASWTSQTEVAVQGDASFRPVGMSIADDGSIYVTDWVDRSYPVHRKGRLWRLSRASDVPITDVPATDAALPTRTEAEIVAHKLQADEGTSVDDRIAALEDDDPFLRQASIAGLISSGQLKSVERKDALSPRQRVGLLTAWRWLELASPENVSTAERKRWIDWGLNDDSQDVVMAAVRWATERGLNEYLDTIRGLLRRPSLSPRTFSAVIASIAYLETGSASSGRRDPQRERLLYQYAANPDHSPETRALAIRMLPGETEDPTSDELAQWLVNTRDRELGIEIVRLLSERGDQNTFDVLASIAKNDTIPEQTRADALASLSKVAGQYARVVNSLSLPSQPDALRDEARRMSRRTWMREPQRPSKTDLDAWAELISDGGNRDAGRRVFFRATCVNCHAYQGRGATTGPDLSTLSGQMTARRLMESILEPSKEIGPLYVPWRVLRSDGQILTGLKLDASGVGQAVRFQGADGMIFEVSLEEIEEQEPIRQSIMPTGLEQTMSIQELRDLAAFLIGDNAE